MSPMQISPSEFERLSLRVHAFLRGVPLHDAWAVDLPRPRTGITLDAFLRRTNGRLFTPSPAVRALLGLRLSIGRLLGWEQTPAGGDAAVAFADRLTPEDRARTLSPAGARETPDGLCRVVYQFENERLSEVVNRTAHAGALSALIETAGGYRFYFAVYVRHVGRLTPVYLALIDPFRKWVVYPSLLRSVRANWERAFSSP